MSHLDNCRTSQHSHINKHDIRDSVCRLRTSTPFKEIFSDHFKDLHKLKLLRNFDVNLKKSIGSDLISIDSLLT